jgi:regulator of cell morphogenesis and NO signaling
MPTILEKELHVSLLEPRRKHPTIFEWFDDLPAGDSFVIKNDHDPKPLYYQMLGERGNVFKWEYLEQGPETWRVRITKRAEGDRDETLGEIAAKDLRKAEVFKKYGLDFCCGGKKTVKEACEEKGMDVTKIEQELQQADRLPVSRPLPYNEWNLDFLADYIVNTHHSYVKKTLPEIRSYAQKVAQVHGAGHPELGNILAVVESVYAEMSSHMVKEEQVVFPYIKQLVNAKSRQDVPQAETLQSVKNPINLMEMEHELVGKNMEIIRQLANNYILPAEACATYSLLYRLLQEFEEDLHMHVHLENNILFPKAIAAEKKLNEN